jgi:O-antigen chain-terminating methyltransferase
MNARTPDSLRQRIISIPVLGYLLRLGWYLARLPGQFDRTAQQHEEDVSTIARLQQQLEAQQTEVALQGERNVKFDQQIGDLRHGLRSLKASGSERPHDHTAPTAPSSLLADDHDMDSFYVEFENKFRGTEEEIKKRVAAYVPRLKKLGIDFKKHPVLDIGCGRGEFLQVLKERGIAARGLDLNESMVKRCEERGLDVVQADAMDYLSKQKTGSLGVITGFHIVEHIPFNSLLRLFEECHRVVAPGGIVLFETPNPESIHVGSFAFYFDPSHLNPLAPDILAFAIENRGFERAEIVRLHPKGDGQENVGRDDKYVAEIVRRFYMAQDYAVIGHKTKA